jgi:S-adenosylmethionine:tRNA ribosyltransferase-isomerase
VTNPIGPELLTSDFSYELPPELIAQTPIEPREASRLLVLDRKSGALVHSHVSKIREFLQTGDVVVANNSRVIHARLRVRKSASGGQVEILLLKRGIDGIWESLARPAKRLKIGEQLILEPAAGSHLAPGSMSVRYKGREGIVGIALDPVVEENLDQYGGAPLPPYITESLADAQRYQTVYASQLGSAAAPTAGLHFSEQLIDSLISTGIEWLEVTLHIGLDTFRPVTVDRVADHQIHTEWCSMSDQVAELVRRAMADGRRVIALGTTAARTLETAGHRWESGTERGFATDTSVFITPGYEWKVVGAVITNFHLPRSTLLMMVSAFAGRERILAAYEEAIEQRYRFYSFGDAMLIV